MITPEFTISLDNFKLVMRQMKTVIEVVKTGDMMVTYDGSMLNFTMQGATVAIPGQGYWPGSARIGIKNLPAIIKVPPHEDPVTLRIAKSRFMIQTFSIPCTWQEAEPRLVEVPLDASELDILRLRFLHSREELLEAGLLPKLEEIEAAYNGNIEAATAILSGYGVWAKDVRAMCDWIIQKRHR